MLSSMVKAFNSCKTGCNFSSLYFCVIGGIKKFFFVKMEKKFQGRAAKT